MHGISQNDSDSGAALRLFTAAWDGHESSAQIAAGGRSINTGRITRRCLMKTAELKVLPVSVLKPAAYNPRKKRKPGDREYEKIKKYIQKFQFAELRPAT